MTDERERAVSPTQDPRVGTARRIHLTEDWVACLLGLGLLALALSGVIPEGLVP